MGLLDRLFGPGKERDAASHPASTQYHEGDSHPDDSEPPEASRNAPRRELVQVVLRDTMRKHGIPSDWIECRILSAVTRSGRTGLHVNFVVRQAHEQLLAYVFAFQDSFQRELARFEPRSRDWILSLGWEFKDVRIDAMPRPQGWAASGPAPLADVPQTVAHEAPLAFAPTADAVEDEPPKSDEDVQRDLQALFAIRDAALADAAGRPPARDQPDFEPTQPFADSGAPRT